MTEIATLNELIELAIENLRERLAKYPGNDTQEMAELPLGHDDWVNTGLLRDPASEALDAVSDEALVAIASPGQDPEIYQAPYILEWMPFRNEETIGLIYHLRSMLSDFLVETTYYWFQDRHASGSTLAALDQDVIGVVQTWLEDNKHFDRPDAELTRQEGEARLNALDPLTDEVIEQLSNDQVKAIFDAEPRLYDEQSDGRNSITKHMRQILEDHIGETVRYYIGERYAVTKEEAEGT